MSKSGGRRAHKDHAENWLKRQAVQIAGMLPEDPDEALKVLEETRGVIEYLHGRKPPLRVVSRERSDG